jgi:hypothetical protein
VIETIDGGTVLPVVKGFDLDLDKKEALQLVRQRQATPAGRQGTPRPDAWLEAVDRAVDEALRLVRPAIAYDAFPVVAAEPSRLIVGDGHPLESPVVASLFGRAPEVVLMVFTIGSALEERVAALGSSGDYPVAFALDVAGSVMLGKAGEVGYRIIEDMAKAKATKASIPLNPGTSHWPMSGQRLIAELVGAREIGVEGRESGVLHPFKSIAFAVALGDDVLTPAEGSSCDYCDRRDLCRA